MRSQEILIARDAPRLGPIVELYLASIGLPQEHIERIRKLLELAPRIAKMHHLENVAKILERERAATLATLKATTMLDYTQIIRCLDVLQEAGLAIDHGEIPVRMPGRRPRVWTWRGASQDECYKASMNHQIVRSPLAKKALAVIEELQPWLAKRRDGVTRRELQERILQGYQGFTPQDFYRMVAAELRSQGVVIWE